MKLDKYHYHEFYHTVNIVIDMIEDHLINHHVGKNYKEDLENAISILGEVYQKSSNDSDLLFNKCDNPKNLRDIIDKELINKSVGEMASKICD